MRGLSTLWAALLLASCAAAPPALPPPPELVATPVAACPAPPAIDKPYEPVYDLAPADAGNPDKVVKSAEASITSLEAALDLCRSALEVYRPTKAAAP